MKKILLPILFLITLLSINVFADHYILRLGTPTPAIINFADLNSVTVSVQTTITNDDPANAINIKVFGEPVLPNTVPFTDTKTITVSPGTSQQTTLTLSIPRNTKQGTYQFYVIAEDQLAAEIAELPFNIIVNEAPALELFKNTQSLGNTQTGSKKAILLTGERGDESVQLQIKIKNTGNTDFTNLEVKHDFTVDDLTDDDEDTVALSISPSLIPSLTAGSETTVTLTAGIDTGFDIGTITKNLKLVSGSFSNDYQLKVDVRTLACSSVAESKFTIDVVEPDDEQEFEPGDSLRLRVDVTNEASDKKRIKVESSLYNVDSNKKISGSSSSQSLSENEEGTYLFDFILSPEDIDSDDDYVIYIKASDKDDEDVICSQESFDLDIEIPEHKVIMDSINLLPTSVSCGGTVSGSVLLRNLGSNVEKVIFSAENTDLNVAYSSQELKLEEIDEEDANSVLQRFSFNIPFSVNEGTYNINLKANYGSRSVEEQKTITVSSCGEVVNTQEDLSERVTVKTDTDFVDLTGSAVTEKSFFEKFSTGSYKVPTSVWVLADIALVIIILASLVAIFRRR